MNYKKDFTGDGVLGAHYKYNRKLKRNIIGEVLTYSSILIIMTSVAWFLMIVVNYQPAMRIIENIIAGAK